MRFESKNFGSTNKQDAPSRIERNTFGNKLTRSLQKSILVGALTVASYIGYEKFYGGIDYSSEVSFNAAFKKAREHNEKDFRWKGKKFTTDLVDKEFSQTYWESKKFLENYYTSAYFKSKNLPTLHDSLAISSEIGHNIFMSPRYKELVSKLNSDKDISHAELDELNQYLSQMSFKNIINTEEFKHNIDYIGKSRIEDIIKNLHTPTYMSITHKKGDRDSDGSYNQKSRKLFLYSPIKHHDETVAIHELTHKSTNNDSIFIYNNKYDNLKLRALESMKNNSNFLTKYDKKAIEYLSDPTEIDARQNATRFWLSKHFPAYTVNTVFAHEHHAFLKEHYKALPYEIKQLLDLFTSEDIFISNMNTY